MFIKVNKIIKKCDLFGQNIQLNFKNKEQYKTTFGGMVSILIIIFLIILFYNKIIDLFQKRNFKITVKQSYLDDSPLIVLDSTNFLLAFAIEENSELNFTQFNISVSQAIVHKTSNGRHKQVLQLNISNCTRKHFAQLGLDEKFQAYSFDRYLCFPLDKPIELQGSHDSELFSYLEISVLPCMEQNQLQLYENNPSFKFKIITSNVQINPSQRNPIQQTLFGNDFYFTFQPNKTVLFADIFIREVYFEEDQSIIPYYSSILKDQLTQVFYEDIRQNLLIENNSPYYCKFFIRSHSKSSTILKEYQQLDEYFAYLGGLIRIAFGLISLVIVEYNRYDLFLSLANRLYNFQVPGIKQDPYENVKQKIHNIANNIAAKLTKQHRQSKNLKKLQSIVEKYGDHHKTESEQVKIQGGKNKKFLRYDQHDIVEVQTRESFLDYVYKEVANHTIMIQMRFKYLISRWSYRHIFYKDPYIQLIDTAIKQIQSHLNVQTMINNFQCLDRMKEVVLNTEQKKLIDFVPKPILKGINIRKLKDKKTKKKQRFKKAEMFDKVENLKELFRAFRKLYRSKEVLTLKEKEVNEILFSMLGEELKEIFEFTMHLKKQSHEEENHKKIVF